MNTDPFGLMYKPNRDFGFDIVESPNRPRYVLPEEIIPGVPWKPGFREEINKWSLEFLGTVNVVPKGQVYILNNKTALMRPEDIVRIQTIC